MQTKSSAVSAKVVQVIDGDTFKTAYVIRLADVDAPELDEPGGPAAKRELERLIGGKDITYEEKARDVYGRIVAQVWVNGIDVNAAMRRFLSQ